MSTQKYNWRKFLALSDRYKAIQIQLLNDACLPDMTLRQLLQWGGLLVSALRHSHKIVRAGTEDTESNEHWGEIRRSTLSQLAELAGLLVEQLESGGEDGNGVDVFLKCQTFGFASTCASALQEEAQLDREQMEEQDDRSGSLELTSEQLNRILSEQI